MSSIRQSENYRFIDIFKFICAFLIIGIHTSPFQEIGILNNAFGVLTRIAVPFFFVSSSFFLFRKDFSWKRIAGYCKRMLLLYFIYSVIYVIYELLSGQFVLNGFLIKFFISGYQHLWFLQQSVIAVLIISFITKVIKSPLLLYVLAALFYVIGVLMFTYRPLVNDIPIVQAYHSSMISQIIFERSCFFYAVPYMAIGYYFANNSFVKKSYSATGIIVSFILLAVEGFIGINILHASYTVLWFSVIPLSFFLFSFVAQVNVKKDFNTVILRKLSTLIYCIHLLVVFLLNYFDFPLHILLFMSASIISLFYGVIILKLSSLKYFKFLKVLY